MNEQSSPSQYPRGCRLNQAASEFYFLQNQHYPRKSALEWVGNRHRLTRTERELLHRGVFSSAKALLRRAKRCCGSDWQSKILVVDGHNVQITVESALLQRPLVLANDGALRDLAGQSAQFRFSEVSELAMDMIFRFLARFQPRRALFFFDAPMSRSGYAADQYRRRMQKIGLAGEAKAVPVPEREFPYEDGVLASSDQAVLEASEEWLDLARWIMDLSMCWRPAANFSSLATNSGARGKPAFLCPLKR